MLLSETPGCLPLHGSTGSAIRNHFLYNDSLITFRFVPQTVPSLQAKRKPITRQLVSDPVHRRAFSHPALLAATAIANAPSSQSGSMFYRRRIVPGKNTNFLKSDYIFTTRRSSAYSGRYPYKRHESPSSDQHQQITIFSCSFKPNASVRYLLVEKNALIGLDL